MALLFAGSVVAWAAAARAFGPRVALLVAVALLVYPAYGLMFHEISSEPLFAAAFALWALARHSRSPAAVACTASHSLGWASRCSHSSGLETPYCSPSPCSRSFSRATGVARATLGRSVSRRRPHAARRLGGSERRSLRRLHACARRQRSRSPSIAPSSPTGSSRPTTAPHHGGSRDAIQQHLLTRDPYKSYGVTLDEVFSSGSFRIHEDLYLLSDQVFGWDSNYSVLRNAGRRGRRGASRASTPRACSTRSGSSSASRTSASLLRQRSPRGHRR